MLGSRCGLGIHWGGCYLLLMFGSRRRSQDAIEDGIGFHSTWKGQTSSLGPWWREKGARKGKGGKQCRTRSMEDGSGKGKGQARGSRVSERDLREGGCRWRGPTWHIRKERMQMGRKPIQRGVGREVYG